MADNTWTYGGLEVRLSREADHVGALTMILGAIGLIAAPLFLSGWAIVHWFPQSVPVALTIAVLAWTAMFVSATDEDDLLSH